MDNINIIQKIKRTIMIVDDEFINQEILKAILGNDYDILTASNGKEALDILHQDIIPPISLIMLDINMPVMDGLEFLKIIKAEDNFKKIPIIVLTVEKDNELKSLELGAADFIKKPYDVPEIIRARVKRTIELSEDRLIIQAAERDELTGAYNKDVFVEYVSRMDKYKKNPVNDMVVVNVDHFHLFNEIYGRDEGNILLKNIADALKDVARSNDGIVGRLQADYFMMYLKNQTDYDAFYDSIHEKLIEYHSVDNFRLRMGIYTVTDSSEHVDVRIDRAKLVCDELRSTSLNNYNIYDKAVQDKSIFNERLLLDLPVAIKERQLEVYYQPKFNVVGDKPVLASAEALIRWNHPEYGFLSPGLFIPLLEENYSVRFVDHFVWNEVAAQIAKWKKEYGKTIPVSVNVSRTDMYDENIIPILLDAVRNNGITANDLLLEITESAYNSAPEQLIGVVNNLKEHGFRIEIDDFGSGYSSLNALASIQFDILKLDMKFVREMNKNEKTMKMVQIVSDIGRLLNVLLVAEGVETEEQYLQIKKLGYHVIQGYYFSKPVKVSEFEKFLKED